MPGRRYRKREVQLERALGAPALFATVYGNVGSSIYYALGVTAAFALGLTPLVFVVAGVIFACTTLTYAEGTVRFPEAGGSSSFARHAFDEVVSFGAAWAQMLNYVITISISAFFVPHYLSIFWKPLNSNPWDIVVGALVIVVLVGINVVGVREAAGLNITLSVIDFSTQVLLVILGFALIFSPETLTENVHWGVAPTWSQFALAIPIGMIAYTGIETVSNLAEEARDPARNVPRSYLLTAVAVFAIYFTLPAIALSALPVERERASGEYETLLGLPPEEGGYANDPILGVVRNLGIEEGRLLDVLEIYVGVLAATILFIATNAGIIGASRITYAMSSHRQLPETFRRLHPKLKTPWLALVVFAGIVPILTLLPGQVDFLGTMYAFGAMLSFTIAHISLVVLRSRDREAELAFRGRPNVRLGGVDWPLFAFLGAVGTGLAWIVVVVQTPEARYAGFLWLAIGFAVYVVYRRRQGLPLRETVKAPPAMGPALALEYRRLVVPVIAGQPSDDAMDVACRLAAERGSRIVALSVIEVPLDRDLAEGVPESEAEANRELDEAVAIGESYGVPVVGRLERARSAGKAIVEEARGRDAEIIVIGSPRRRLTAAQAAVFGKTVDYVLRHAPCRVLVTASEAT